MMEHLSSLRGYVSLFFRAFAIVALTAANVVIMAHDGYAAACVTGGLLSAVWWSNAHSAAHSRLPGGRWVYAAGAAVGTVCGMAAARWWAA